MIALALAIQISSPIVQQGDPPEIAELSRRLELLARAGSQAIVEPLLRCVRAKADGTRPQEALLGDRTAAVRAADSWLRECHGDETRATLVAALTRSDRSIDPDEARSAAEAGMGMATFVTHMLAHKIFRITGSEAAPLPVEIPRPPEDHAQD